MADAIAERTYAAGVVGAGGGGFPTHLKLARRAEYVIANGAECEPLLANDQELLRRQWPEVLSGLRLVARATGAQKLVLAVKGKSRQLLPAQVDPDVAVKELPDCYPAGDEHEVVALATGRVVPEGGLPVDVGVVVQNVETLRNVARAWQERPVTQRTITLGGAVQQPRVLEVPIGATVRDLLAVCGGVQCDAPVFFLGGVMMGVMTTDLDTPVDKTTAAVIVLPREHVYTRQRSHSLDHQLRNAGSACTQCMLCTETCNRYLLGHALEPHRVMRTVAVNMQGDSRVARMALLCSECGACEYACPMGLSPRLVNRAVKQLLRVLGVGGPKPRAVVPRVPAGSGRIPTKRLMARFGLLPYSREAAYWEGELAPSKVHIRLKQHAGVPARPVVTLGQRVKAGQLIGDVPAEQMGARVHASISGRVAHVDEEMVTITAE